MGEIKEGSKVVVKWGKSYRGRSGIVLKVYDSPRGPVAVVQGDFHASKFPGRKVMEFPASDATRLKVT